MNLTRLMALGALARQGNLHGHQIRRWAETTGVGYWGGVSVGALYRELRSLEGEGLVEAIRTKKMGRRPARTVYAITGEEQLELAMLRETAIRDLTPGPDPLGVALTFAGPGDDLDAFASWMRGRRDQLAIVCEQLTAEMERLTARGYVSPVEASVMHRAAMLLETEVRWHDEFAKLGSALEADGQQHTAPATARPYSSTAGHGDPAEPPARTHTPVPVELAARTHTTAEPGEPAHRAVHDTAGPAEPSARKHSTAGRGEPAAPVHGASPSAATDRQVPTPSADAAGWPAS